MLKWRNDFSELKKNVEDGLGSMGKWSSSDGGTKRFKEENGQLILNCILRRNAPCYFKILRQTAIIID
jgi:hypothetical protein